MDEICSAHTTTFPKLFFPHAGKSGMEKYKLKKEVVKEEILDTQATIKLGCHYQCLYWCCLSAKISSLTTSFFSLYFPFHFFQRAGKNNFGNVVYEHCKFIHGFVTRRIFYYRGQ